LALLNDRGTAGQNRKCSDTGDWLSPLTLHPLFFLSPHSSPIFSSSLYHWRGRRTVVAPSAPIERLRVTEKKKKKKKTNKKSVRRRSTFVFVLLARSNGIRSPNPKPHSLSL
jgi:hypothetical protein